MSGSVTHLLAIVWLQWFLMPRSIWAIACPGCLELDDLIFNKTIKRFPYALIKFDIAFPYGESHDAFAAFSQAAHMVTDDLLIGTVGIKDYGEYENKELGKRYNVDDKKYPVIYLFRHGLDDYLPLPYHETVTLDILKTFISTNTELFIGKEGCLKEYNELAKGFVNLESGEQKSRIQQAKVIKEKIEKENERINAQHYITFMEKLLKLGYDFVEQETKRLQRLKAGKVTVAKKRELGAKLNILEAFRVNVLKKEEL